MIRKMGDPIRIRVRKEEAGRRLDIFLAEKMGMSRSQIQRHIYRGEVSLNNSPLDSNYRIKEDQVISVDIMEESAEGLIPEPIQIKLLFRDEHVVVVDKPAGMVVYPAAGHRSGTLMNALAYHCPKLAGIGGPLRPGVVHRLDKDTSGVMVVALEDKAYYNLVEQFRSRTVKRKYTAFVYGDMKGDSGEISLSIGRSDSDRKKMSTRTRRGKEAMTRWKVVKRFGVATLLELRLGTGRTHQIRVHLASAGHPVLGDRTYGKKTEIEAKKKRIGFPRQMLHAEMLGFTHPSTGRYIEFSSPLPDDMNEAVATLETVTR